MKPPVARAGYWHRAERRCSLLLRAPRPFALCPTSEVGNQKPGSSVGAVRAGPKLRATGQQRTVKLSGHMAGLCIKSGEARLPFSESLLCQSDQTFNVPVYPIWRNLKSTVEEWIPFINTFLFRCILFKCFLNLILDLSTHKFEMF